MLNSRLSPGSTGTRISIDWRIISIASRSCYTIHGFTTLDPSLKSSAVCLFFELRFLFRKTTFFITDPLVWLFLHSVDGLWINLIFCFLIYNPKHRYNNGPRKPCCSVRDCRPQNIISTLSCINSKSWDPVLQVFLSSKTEFCYEYRLELGPTNWIYQQSYRRT